jgi:magnesium-protoporphyrin IX monomethyl ester (oxidative) cyclase
MPSIALTQLKYVVDQRFDDRVETKIHYINHDVANYVGLDLYEEIGGAYKYVYAGFGEWFFRQVAFPEQPDNTKEYFQRFYPLQNEETLRFQRFVEGKRRGARELLENLIDKYELAKADLVGITSHFFANVVSFALARLIKHRNPSTLVVMGGANCDSPAGEEIVRQFGPIDFVFSGCGLKSFPDFIQACIDNDDKARERINGVFSKSNCDLKSLDAPATRLSTVLPTGDEYDINNWIELDYDSYFDDLEQNFPEFDIRPTLPFETARGCWWGERSHCTFCGLNRHHMNYRPMKSENAVRLIRSLFRYAQKSAMLMSTDNILPLPYIKEVLPRLDTPENLTIFYQLKANLRDEDVKTFARARVKQITPGFEALSSYTLDLMAKGVTAFKNIEVMKLCLKYDVFPGWSFLVGSPGEPESVYAKYYDDLDHFVHLPPPQGLFTIAFHRFSPHFMKAAEYGLDLKPIDYYAFTYPYDINVMANIAFEFKDQSFGEYKIHAIKWFDRLHEKVQRWIALWDEGKPQPMLFIKRRGDAAYINDSRSGKLIEYAISKTSEMVLSALCQHRGLKRLQAMLGYLSGFDAKNEIEDLSEKGLIFREGEKFLSLVMMEEPKPMTNRLYNYLVSTGFRVKKKLPENAEGELDSSDLSCASHC